MSQESIPPHLMLRSFLTVGSGFVLVQISIAIITVALGYALFPDFVAFLDLDKDQQKALFDNTPEKAISRTMFIAMVGFSMLACFLIGIYVYRFAPFANFPHVVFLSVLVFIFYLQTAISDAPAKKTMTIAYMLLFPLSILLGGKSVHRVVYLDDDSAEDSGQI